MKKCPNQKAHYDPPNNENSFQTIDVGDNVILELDYSEPTEEMRAAHRLFWDLVLGRLLGESPDP
jgi:hypothetical protein